MSIGATIEIALPVIVPLTSLTAGIESSLEIERTHRLVLGQRSRPHRIVKKDGQGNTFLGNCTRNPEVGVAAMSQKRHPTTFQNWMCNVGRRGASLFTFMRSSSADLPDHRNPISRYASLLPHLPSGAKAPSYPRSISERDLAQVVMVVDDQPTKRSAPCFLRPAARCVDQRP
jgi:hypothetical protein